MGTSEELVWLLHQIRSSGSPIERLKLLARGWRTVRGLSADDRRRLARELGVDGAEELIEQLARRGGMSPSHLLSMLHRAEQADPAEVMDTIRGLGEPERRREAAGELLDTVSEVLVDEETQATHEPAASGQLTGRVEAQHAPATPAPQPSLPQEPPPPAVPSVDSKPGQPSGATPSGTASVQPPAVPARRRPAAAAEMPGAPAASETAPFRDPVDQRTTDAAAGTVRRSPSGAGLAEQLGTETSLLRRLRWLSASADRLEVAGLEELRAVLECFPAGWARRRALQRLFEAGVPRAVADAVELLGLLERPSERLWAATTLAGSRWLDDSERKALLATAPTPVVRRRLGRRLAAQ